MMKGKNNRPKAKKKTFVSKQISSDSESKRKSKDTNNWCMELVSKIKQQK